MVDYASIIIFSVLAGISTLLGTLIVLKKKQLSDEGTVQLISFSAGALLGLTFLHLIPEALSLNENAVFGILGAFACFYFLEQRIMMHSCVEEECDHHHFERSKGLMGMWGILLHSLIDGALIGIGFEASISLGVVTALAVLIHKIPDGISVTSIMVHNHFSKSEAWRGALLTAMATPVGALLASILLQEVAAPFIGIALGISAGTFLYISASDLVPETHKKFNFWNGFYMLFGLAAIFLLKNI